MRIFIDIWFVIAILSLVWCVIELIRNNRVFKYRITILDRVSVAAKSDLKKDRDYTWRYDAFIVVNYEKMVFKFWKPLDSFYKDFSFLDPAAKGPTK